MGRGAARLLVGSLVLAAAFAAWAVLGPASSSAEGARSSVVTGAVAEDGSGVVPAGWVVEHPVPGFYVVRAPASVSNDLDVATWDAPADVSVTPVGAGAVEIRFTAADGGQPVDARFTWRSLVAEV